MTGELVTEPRYRWTCDRCGLVVERGQDRPEGWGLLSGYIRYNNDPGPYRQLDLDLCDRCLPKLGRFLDCVDLEPPGAS